NIAENVAVPQQETTAYHTQTLQHATLQSVAVPQHKKRGLFGRVLNAVFDND
ncbi:DNA-binding protein, partial [Acinetobacter baumannii]|nr:DNA-binding protein [Acinetobacter baumannii]MBV6597987.1 DNA-binding protein [Acinetobacter baumannii]MBV6598167.1 DNA-binding protein [Acinetobacter baumannii]MBV6621120.1 DNA-binding protein [Acinetobacter baumannii]MCY3318050.1 DNA-binding protein [Acinetobacter baumannii]